MVEYTISETTTLKLNVTNLTDELYADSLYRGFYAPGAARTVQLTLKTTVLNRAARTHTMLLHLKNILTPEEVRDRPQACWAIGAPGSTGAAARAAQAADPEEQRATRPRQRGRARVAGHWCWRAVQPRPAVLFCGTCRARYSTRCSTATAAQANTYGAHVDGAVLHSSHHPAMGAHRHLLHALPERPRQLRRRRTAWSRTPMASQRIKLPAGDMVIYPGTSVHRVEPVTRGARAGQLFLGREHGAQRRTAPPAVRPRHEPAARCASNTAKPPRPPRSPARTTTCLRMWADT